jgi:type I restriction enzyme S subunit
VRAPVGDINMAQQDCCIGRGLGAISSNNKLHSYTYHKILSLQKYLKTFDNEGTVFGSINKDTLGNIQVIIPPNQIIEQFNSLTKDSDLLIYTFSIETDNLIKLRDTLLPKLISGELEVNEALI